MKNTPQRILLKLSGEALMGNDDFGINPDTLKRIAEEILALCQSGIELGLVIGGGNLFRGAGLAKNGLERPRGDHIGMLATVMNALAMQDQLQRLGLDARTLSSFAMHPVCEHYSRDLALHHLNAKRITLFAAGTGNPFFTTDTAASLRAIEIGADLMIKATKVNGVYSADPVIYPDAVFYQQLSYEQVLNQRLAVMDTTAVVLCQENQLPLRVMNINEAGALQRLIQGESVGTLIH